MPRLQTAIFGSLYYEDDAVLHFPAGLPGFENHRRFVLVEQPALRPLVHLQSLESAELYFLALPVQTIDPGYQPALTPEDGEVLGNPASPLLLALLAVGDDGQITANLMAPVCVNLATRIAVQAVRADRRYSHQHQLGEVAVCS